MVACNVLIKIQLLTTRTSLYEAFLDFRLVLPVREAKVRPPRGPNEAVLLVLLLCELIEQRDLLRLEIDDGEIGLDPRRGDGLGKGDDAAVDLVRDENRRGLNRVRRGDLGDGGLSEERGGRRAERGISLKEDANEGRESVGSAMRSRC